MTALALSGERFRVVYRIQGAEAEARRRAEEICIEQTVEFPPDLIDSGPIRDGIFGRVESFAPTGADGSAWNVSVSYAIEVAGTELTQLLNVVFGNTSLKPGIRVEHLEPTAGLLESFRGPRFGVEGLRALLGIAGRPLLCTAVKPMGLSPAELGRLAGAFAAGGIDCVKDDHGLADQPFCRFSERVGACVEAVGAHVRPGSRCLYFANVTASPLEAIERAHLAKDLGAGGLLVAPGLCGWDTMRALSEDPNLGLPVICHPALLGSFHSDARHGIAHGVLYGQMARLAGADATIFPSYGGRFSFTRDDCRALVRGATERFGSIRSIVPVPAGGMTVERVPELLEFYGLEVMLLIGGDLHRHGSDLAHSCASFLERVTETSVGVGR